MTDAERYAQAIREVRGALVRLRAGRDALDGLEWSARLEELIRDAEAVREGLERSRGVVVYDDDRR